MTTPPPRARRPIIGFICTWPIYQGMIIDRYAHTLLRPAAGLRL